IKKPHQTRSYMLCPDMPMEVAIRNEMSLTGINRLYCLLVCRNEALFAIVTFQPDCATLIKAYIPNRTPCKPTGQRIILKTPLRKKMEAGVSLSTKAGIFPA